jgi:hypothetical protein
MAFWLAAAVAASTAVSFMGSLNQSRQLRAAAKADKRTAQIKNIQETIAANERATFLLSEKRAAQGARGVVPGKGSTLLEQQSVVDDYEDNMYWIDKSFEYELNMIDFRLAGALAKESYSRNVNLITGAASAYALYKAPPIGTTPSTTTTSSPTALVGGPAGQTYNFAFDKFFTKLPKLNTGSSF